MCMHLSVGLCVCVWVPTEAREGRAWNSGVEVEWLWLWVPETERGCSGCPRKHSVTSLAQQFSVLRNLVESLEYCPNFIYLPHQICNSILKSMLEQNNKTYIYY